MDEHHFTTEERRRQLRALAHALRELLPVVTASSAFQQYAPAYEAALARTLDLVEGGFTQGALSDLARSVPDPFGRASNPRWEIPLEQAEDGTWREAEGFGPLDHKLRAALQAAEKLRTVGYY